MHRYSLLILIAMLVAGCRPHLEKKVVGTWKIDLASIAGKQVKQAKENPGLAEAVKKLGDSRFRFEADGTMSASSPNNPGAAAKWLMDGRKILISAPVQEQQAQVPTLELSEDDKRIHMESADKQFRCDLVRESS